MTFYLKGLGISFFFCVSDALSFVKSSENR